MTSARTSTAGHRREGTYLGASETDGALAAHDLADEEREQEHHERERHADGDVRERVAGSRALGQSEDLARGVDGRRRAHLRPLAVAVDDRVLEAVDELRERDVLAVLEDVDRAELLVRAVAELEAEEVARVRRGRAAQLDRDGRAEVSCGRPYERSVRGCECDGRNG